ncbi:SusC/RagA family TonB-linked outer membrane protein [Pedobacter changchengzhani]|uniref:SusC/RagA family TonB-linked outer membrane protein n=1 Tax=Pedobacter changchengzhani TaxID=2529274 RepID=A0A4R5MQ96_9SPHI|nr:SusC/RagA family TonB-linked outer membrane protein [Pedobacter changchengzhani]TDG38022.1 SusC/RagA family TonB-linked outer membrane protein [Pedobacter changchengzhani]
MEKNYYKRRVKTGFCRMALIFLAVFSVFLAKAEGRQAKSENERLDNYLKKIEIAYKVSFVYDANEIKKNTILVVPEKLSSITESLDQLKQKNIGYQLVGKQVILKLQQPLKASISKDIVVKGRIKDKKDGSTLPGVSVMEKGTNNAVSTNAQGDFTIKVKEGATIIVRSVGYKTQEVVVNGRTFIEVSISEDTNQLNEVNVVSTGYQTLDRKLFTGASSLVKAEDSQRAGVPDVSRMLEGQVAGVSVQNVSGTFGAAPKIRVRGATSISGDNKPLFVVDGIVLEDVVNISNDALSTGDPNTLVGSSLAGLNPNDIESFTVLKDAAATAMYGARAMNGVIVITSKKGRQSDGRPTINYTTNLTTYAKPNYSQFDILNSADQLNLDLELLDKGYFGQASTKGSNVGLFGKMYDAIYNYNPTTNSYELKNDGTSRLNFLNRYANANTNWFDVLYKNSLQQEHSLSLSSGTEKFQTYASTSYLHDSGQTLGNSVNRYTGNFRANLKLSDKLSGEFLVNGSIRDQKAPGAQNSATDALYGTVSRSFDINPYSYALNTSRAITPYNSDGSLEYFTRSYAPFNIINEIANNYISIGQIDLKVQGGIKYKIIPSLTYSIDGSYRYVKTQRQATITENANAAQAFRAGANDPTVQGNNPFLFQDPDQLDATVKVTLPSGGFYNINDDNLKNFYFRQNLEYNKTFNEDHKVNFFGSMETRYIDRQYSNFDGVGYQYGNGGIVNADYNYFKKGQIGNAPYFGMGFGSERFAAFALRGAYAYKDKYSFNATTRYDGSNLLGASTAARWLPTWNVSGAWNVDQESFWPKNNILSSARIRATYGLVANLGNASNAAALYYSELSKRPYSIDKETQTYISSLANTELTWEKLKEANLGIDLSFIKDRLNLTVDLYQRNIYDLIGQIKTSGIGGQYTKTANYGKMKAKGLEFTLAGNAISSTDFKWRTQFNFAFNKNKITELENSSNVFNLIDDNGGPVVGNAQAGLYSLQFAGLDHNYGYPYFIDTNGKRNTFINLQATDIAYLKYEGPIDPTFTGGFYNSFKYKQFVLSGLFTFAAGNYVRLGQSSSAEYTDFTAMSKNLSNRWEKPGDENFTSVPAILDLYTSSLVKDADGNTVNAKYAYNSYNFSTENVAKGDYIKLKQISLGYEVPQSIAKKLKMSSASLSVVANNLVTIYSDKRLNGQDPEFFSNGGVALPVPQQFTLSLKVGF